MPLLICYVTILLFVLSAIARLIFSLPRVYVFFFVDVDAYDACPRYAYFFYARCRCLITLMMPAYACRDILLTIRRCYAYANADAQMLCCVMPHAARVFRYGAHGHYFDYYLLPIDAVLIIFHVLRLFISIFAILILFHTDYSILMILCR